MRCAPQVESDSVAAILLRQRMPIRMKLSILFSVVAIVLPWSFCHAQGDSVPVPRQHWSAMWISHPTAPLREPLTLHFKKTLELAAVPNHFVVHVSADNRFVLYVNGARVGDGPARGDLAHWRYETFDLAPMLKAGENTVAATVWNAGIYAPIAQISDRTGFLLEGDTAAESGLNTGAGSKAGWMVEMEPGQVVMARPVNAFGEYVAAGWGEAMRGAQYDWDWMGSGTGPGWVMAGSAHRESVYSGAGTANARGVTAEEPWSLVPDTLPHMAYEPESAGRVVRSSVDGADGFPARAVAIAAHTHGHILLDRAEETTAYPKLSYSGGKGAKVTLTYAEALYDEHMHKGNRNEVGTRRALGISDEIYPDGGERRVFEPLWWRTWRYVDVEVETADEPLKLEGMEAHFTAYPFVTKAKFAASDGELEKIWAIGWHTARLDAHETYMDCPYYEQLQYGGDTRIQALITYAMTADDRLPKQAIRALNDSRTPDGITASRYPSSLPQYIPTFSLLWIGMIHDHYMYRPDTALVKEMLPGTRTVLSWFASYQHEDGLLGKLPWWSFVDWVSDHQENFPSYDKNGESCLTTLQYVGALEDAIDLESHLGDPAYVETYKKRLAAAKHGVMSQCWDARAGLVADSPAKDSFSQHANILAVLHDVVANKDEPELMRKVIGGEIGLPVTGMPNLIQASYYFRFYLARALDHVGMADDYLKTLGSWRGFLKMGFTTWPEQPGDTRSDAHAWSSHPTYDLLTLVAGIGPAEPGFKTVRIAPHLGDLTRLEATFPHELGLIHVKYVDGMAMIELPAELSGVFVWKGKETKLHGGANVLPLGK